MRPKNLEKVGQIKRKNTTKKNNVESTPVKRDERLDKMKKLEQLAHTPVKWIGMKRT